VDEARIRTILSTSPTVAVLGIHHDPSRAAFYVPEYLHEQGYTILGVNPTLTGQTLFGHPVVGSLAELAGPIDLIDVFRRSEWLPDHVDELIAAKPRVVWMQLGVHDDGVARKLEAAGIEVVMDRCTMADHRRLRVGPPRAQGASSR
jgi:predicted CoA-binding protein